jgi:ATP-dependent 26S proteasome regulatory subunit
MTNLRIFDKSNLIHGLIHIIPFWSTNIIQILKLGNEYNLLFTIIMTELIHFINDSCYDIVLFIIIILGLVFLISIQLNLKINIKMFQLKSITLEGKEIISTEQSEIIYSEKIIALNYYLLYHCNIDNITYLNDSQIMINNIYGFKLMNSIYLDITRIKLENHSYIVKYKIWSYNQELTNCLDKIMEFFKHKKLNEIRFVGIEKNNILEYPEPIHAINFKIISKNDNSINYKCMIMKSNVVDNTENEEKKVYSDEYSYTLDNLNQYPIENDVFLTIYRENQLVYYNIKSKEKNCKDWINSTIHFYHQNKNQKFLHKLVITGREELWYCNNSFRKYFYNKEMWALNWYIIEILKYQNFECIPDNNSLYKYVLQSLDLYKIQEDFFITIEKEFQQKDQTPQMLKKLHLDSNVLYILYSNSLNLTTKVNEIVIQFEQYQQNMKKNQILYHFIYNGLKNDQLIFQTRVLSEKNTSQEIYETFDNIYNEHIEMFKYDIDKLKNIDYYKKHGLKRKKGYLFYGSPGCGKTSSVVAMAVYDSRHIIEIPFSILSTHEEFDKLLNLDAINNIEISKNNIIILFDEMDFGIDKFSSSKDISEISSPKIIVSPSIINENTLNTTQQKLNMATLLSKLDGIGNYNGIILIGTTNHLDKLDSALYRDLRLTPVHFQALRKQDCIKIIQSYFGSYDIQLNEILKDRVITASKLVSLCHTWDFMNINDFFKYKLAPIFSTFSTEEKKNISVIL